MVSSYLSGRPSGPHLKAFLSLSAFLLGLSQVIICLVFGLGLGGGNAWGKISPQNALPALLKARIESKDAGLRFHCQNELVCGIAELPLFYRQRKYAPAWIDGRLNLDKARELITAIYQSEQEGLNPADYHLAGLEKIINTIQARHQAGEPTTPEVLVDVDILLSDAFLLLASNYRGGRINPETIHTSWSAFNPEVDMSAVLTLALATGQIAKVLKSQLPPHAGYAALRRDLARLRAIRFQGGFLTVPTGPTLREGDRDPRTAMLGRQLIISGDLVANREMPPLEETDPNLFDSDLTAAVKRFQQRHGLEDDGAVGRKTLAALNVPLDQRILQVKLNLERWRWIAHDLGRTYVLVNIADFKLVVVDNDRTVMTMRVVVGRNYHRTPVFSAPMKYLVLNPFWNVPRSIAVKEILPKLKQNLEYLDQKKIKIFGNWRQDATALDPNKIDWSGVAAKNFTFRFRQDPGENNALGRIKFMFPNKYAVYLHDTPAKTLFDNLNRNLSHGCIRLEKPVELAALLLNGEDGWNAEKLRETIDSGQQQIIRLTRPIMVHLLYWTAWVDANGCLQFRSDIYKRDPPLAKALQERHPRD